jgi:hypothetical protein
MDGLEHMGYVKLKEKKKYYFVITPNSQGQVQG